MIARGFAQANGVTLDSVAREHGGTRVRLSFPVRAHGDGDDVVKQRILVIDDEPQFLRALSTNLRGAGYEVDTAATAADALAAAPLRPPDAVILDLLLPDGSGRDVCRELRAWSEAPIILVSAVGDDDEKIAALDAGADDYVTKPFAIGELLARLRAVLRRAGSPDQPVRRGRADPRRSREVRPSPSTASSCT